jgi:RND superfamily putative drug exporter
VLAAGLPIVAAVSTIAGALLVLLGASYVLDLSADIVSVVTVLGLGLAIDYGLLIVSRFREERATGAEVPEAVVRTCGTAGRTVAFSGITVAASLSGLLVFDDPSYRSIGAAGVAVVLVAVASALTLTPALLALIGRRLAVPAPTVEDDGRFAQLARRVQRRPLLVAVAVSVLLASFAAPFLGVRFVEGGPELIPRSFETRQVADAVSTRFAGQEAEPVQVVTDLAPDSPALAGWVADAAGLPGVREVRAPEQLAEGLTTVEVVPGGLSQGDGAQDLVEALRADRPSPGTLVTGSAAYLLDSNRATVERLPWAVALVVLATFVLLFLMTGSVLVPLKALIMNVLSLGASFGALVLVFQEGWLAGPLGVEPAEGLQTWVPVIVFVFAFGLSMDYEVFLLSRIKELVDSGHDNDTAVALGLQRSGRIITSAALLLIIVFAGFAAGQMAAITQLGLAMAIAIAVDATLVRCLLVPATMTLLGDRNWWAPPPLRRLHDRFGLSEQSAPSVPLPRPAPAGRVHAPH